MDSCWGLIANSIGVETMGVIGAQGVVYKHMHCGHIADFTADHFRCVGQCSFVTLYILWHAVFAGCLVFM